MNRSLILLFVLTSLADFRLVAQDDPMDRIVSAIQKSDARSLSTHFNATVDLGLPENDNSYSASQGEMIMKDFFRKYPPQSFEIIQKGTTDPDSRYAIGVYKTASAEFKVYIHLRKAKSGYLIHKIKFEEK
jgi:hypothetical protein